MRKRYRYPLREMIRRLLKIASSIRSYLVISTLSSIFGNLAHIGLMSFGSLAVMCSAGFTEGSSVLYIVLTGICALMIAVCRYLEGVYSHIGAYGLLAGLRVRLFDTLAAVAPAYLVDRKKGDILNIAVNDIETLEFFFAHTIGPMFTVILLPLTTVTIAAHYDPLYALVLVPVFILISILLPLLALRTGRDLGMRYREELGELNAGILESVYGIRDIQIYGYGEKQKQKILKQNAEVSRAAHFLTLHRQTVAALPNFFVNAARVLILAAAVYLSSVNRNDPAGTIVVSFAAAASFSSTFSLTFVVTHLLETFAAAERLFTIEDTVPEVTDPETPLPLTQLRETEFRNVSFTYPRTEQVILENVSFRIRQGDRVGIIGPSGAGKSTVLRLLMRFYKPQSGEILFNGKDAAVYSLFDLHKRIAMLEQETYLFDDTIAGNIALACPDASPEEIREAARRAGIAGLIDTLPMGYDTPMGQMGSRLSGGERQRIGIARIMLADPDIIIMDEPTSALDVLHEKEFLSTLRKEYADKTIIMISHRMSTLSDCETIWKLEGSGLLKI